MKFVDTVAINTNRLHLKNMHPLQMIMNVCPTLQ